jgi:hypothetical protein
MCTTFPLYIFISNEKDTLLSRTNLISEILLTKEFVIEILFNSYGQYVGSENGSMRSVNELLRKSIMQRDKKKYSNKYTRKYYGKNKKVNTTDK